jgi:hypothetical protein
MKIIISSFDMGVRNFAFCVQEIKFSELSELQKINKPKSSNYNIDGTCTNEYNNYLNEIYKTGKIIECKNIDLLEESKNEGFELFFILTHILNKYIHLWDRTNVFLIEQQMSYGKNKSNIQALKLAQHCQSYFYTIYGNFKVIMDYPSQNKTRILGCSFEQRKTHKFRKKFSVELAQKIISKKQSSLQSNHYNGNFFNIKKKDDISDCLLMIETFKIKYLT